MGSAWAGRERKGVTYNADGSVAGCVFCRISSGTEPGGAALLYQDERVVVFQPRGMGAKGHLLVVPKAHIKTVHSLLDDAVTGAALLRHMIDVGMREQWRSTSGGVAPAVPPVYADDRQLVFHLPPANSIDHLHLHVFPQPFEYKNAWKVGCRVASAAAQKPLVQGTAPSRSHHSRSALLQRTNYSPGTPWCMTARVALAQLDARVAAAEGASSRSML